MHFNLEVHCFPKLYCASQFVTEKEVDIMRKSDSEQLLLELTWSRDTKILSPLASLVLTLLEPGSWCDGIGIGSFLLYPKRN